MLLNHLNQKAPNALILLAITVHHVILVTMHLLMVQNHFMLHTELQNCCYLTLSPPQDFSKIQSINCCYTSTPTEITTPYRGYTTTCYSCSMLCTVAHLWNTSICLGGKPSNGEFKDTLTIEGQFDSL